MVETQEELKIGIGNEEVEKLKPAKVKIESIGIETLGKKNSKKVVCMCKHPDKENTIQISEVKYEKQGKLETAGLWVNKDSKGLLRKGSALAVLLQSQGCQTSEQLEGKDVETATDEKGYLCFKAY